MTARAWAEVDLGAVRHNVRTLRARWRPARLCVVVKANGYGHGAGRVGRAALAAGPTGWRGPGRRGGRPARRRHRGARSSLLAEPRPDEVDDAVATGARLTVYSPGRHRGGGQAAGRRRRRPVPVHVKVDTGMHRVGRAPDDCIALAGAMDKRPELRLEGV